jgi:hypothetical protein
MPSAMHGLAFTSTVAHRYWQNFQKTLMTSSRRTFFIQAVTGACALTALSLAQYASAQAMVAESDPQASALGYKSDAATVDKVKYPKHAAGQMCGNCALFQGKPADAAGGCPLFAGKQVASKGWCSAWAKKA